MRIGQYGCHCFEKKGGAMRRARLGLCIGDREYGDRFTSCLMNHYRDQLELHMFSQKEALQENWKTLDAIVLSDDGGGTSFYCRWCCYIFIITDEVNAVCRA